MYLTVKNHRNPKIGGTQLVAETSPCLSQLIIIIRTSVLATKNDILQSHLLILYTS